MTLLAALALGFFLGMRHATDADHVVAVTTIVARTRSLRSALAVGALWGVGHTATILVVGGAIILFGIVIPPRVGLSMELAVAVMLVILGGMNVSGAMKRIDEAAHGHVHGEDKARDPLPSSSSGKGGTCKRGWRAIVVGTVHGLAGSAAVALLVLATIQSAVQALFYLAVFGLGTVLGMALLTAAMALPLAAAANRFKRFERVMARVTGVVSIVFGLVLGYQITVGDGLLSSTPTWDPH